MKALAAALSLLGLPVAASVECSDVTHLGTSYTICDVDPAQTPPRLFLNGPDGRPLGSFSATEAEWGALAFAMNAGMYHDDRSPVGHYVEDGQEVMRVIPDAGPGNFGMLPNGVLCVTEGRARVIETLDFVETGPECRYATQSGPMLVIDGALHHRFIPGSDSRFLRNGVGTSADGTRAVFAISNEPVNFHDFALLFRDGLGLPNALYLDGKISRLHAPSLGRSDGGMRLGPIVGVLE